MMPPVTNALVIGAGIAGPAVALALQHVGIEAVVYEAHAGTADHVGRFLNTASNGIAALEVLGLADAAVAAGIPTPSMTFWSGTGKRLGQVANGNVLPDGKTSTTIRRGDLNRILRRAAQDSGIEILGGRRLLRARHTDHAVRAEFDDGSTATGELLIGADGVHSEVRRAIAPVVEQPRYSGLLSIGGRTHGVDTGAEPGMFHMIFGREAFFSYLTRTPDEVWWFANLPEPEEPPRGSLAAISTGAWREHLLQTFAKDAGPALDLVRECTDELGAYAIHDLPTVSLWHRGHAVLIGDAAHATSPSAGPGASMALESALQLAAVLGEAATLPEALTAYERVRRPRVERVVRYSARLSGTKTAGPIARVVRDLAMPLALRYGASPSTHAWMYDHTIRLPAAGDVASTRSDVPSSRERPS